MEKLAFVLFALVALGLIVEGQIVQKAPSKYKNCDCQCISYSWYDKYNKEYGNCEHFDGKAKWCYVNRSNSCRDTKYSRRFTDSRDDPFPWSYEACTTPERDSYDCDSYQSNRDRNRDRDRYQNDRNRNRDRYNNRENYYNDNDRNRDPYDDRYNNRDPYDDRYNNRDRYEENYNGNRRPSSDRNRRPNRDRYRRPSNGNRYPSNNYNDRDTAHSIIGAILGTRDNSGDSAGNSGGAVNFEQ